jgi:hypothetical protein
MARNSILEELYATREQLLAEYKGDVHAYIQDARARALASGRPIATPKQRPKRSTGAADPGVSKADDHLSSAR